MNRDELIELSDLNLAEANRGMSRRAGGIVHDEDGLCFWAGGHTLPVLINGVLRTRPGISGEDVLERAQVFFERQGRGYTVMLRAHADDDVALAAEALEWKRWGATPAMVLEARLPDAAVPDGVTIEVVDSEEQATAYAEVMGAAYGSLGMPEDVTPAILNLDVLHAPQIVSFLARLEDGSPVAGATTIVTHGVSGIYWVGTTPAARGRGLAELVTRAAGNAGFDLGAKIAALQASEMGEPVYRRMGYSTITSYPTYVKF